MDVMKNLEILWELNTPSNKTWSCVSVGGSMQSVVSVVFRLRPHRPRRPHQGTRAIEAEVEDRDWGCFK